MLQEYKKQWDQIWAGHLKYFSDVLGRWLVSWTSKSHVTTLKQCYKVSCPAELHLEVQPQLLFGKPEPLVSWQH